MFEMHSYNNLKQFRYLSKKYWKVAQLEHIAIMEIRSLGLNTVKEAG